MRQKSLKLNPIIKNLPQKPSTWYLAVRSYPGAKAGQTLHSYILLDKDLQLILDDLFLDQPPRVKELLRVFENNILNPQLPWEKTAQRPMLVEFEQAETWQELAQYLNDAGIASQFNPQPKLVDAFLQQAMQSLVDETEADLLNAPGVTAELAAEFFQAAAAYYRAAPWDKVDNTRPFSIKIEPPGKTFLTLILGKTGEQCSLLFFDSFQELFNFTSEASNPLEMLPEAGIPHINFERLESLSQGDRAAIREYGWEVAGEEAYPQPGIYTQDALLRPDAVLLEELSLALKGILHYVQQAAFAESSGTLPHPAVTRLESSAGTVQVWVRQTEEEEEALPAFGRDFGLLQAEKAHVLEGMELSELAWHHENPSERVRLAKEALAVWSDCIQAHVILGEEASDLEQARQHFERGIAAGERALDPQILGRYLGQYWQIPAARDLLMAIQGKVECLVALEEYEEARQGASKLLSLNTPDHQGMRYTLLFILFQLQQDAQINTLLDQYPHEIAAIWPYSRALLVYRSQGDSLAANECLREAIQRNPHIPLYLSGKEPIDPELDDFDSFGDESEAMHYAQDYSSAWWQTKGAIEWLKRNL